MKSFSPTGTAAMYGAKPVGFMRTSSAAGAVRFTRAMLPRRCTDEEIRQLAAVIVPFPVKGSVTTVGAHGSAVTVSTACKLGPPATSVAEIVAVPGDTPVATHVEPLAVTVATAVLELAQLATAEEPPGFVTVNVDCAPTLTLAVSGAMLAADVTVMVDVRVSVTGEKPVPEPCAVAVITAVPTLTPATTPAPETDATAGLLEL
jgi:hypothetical protein